MAQQTINNNEGGGSVRGKLNSMFGEIYGQLRSGVGTVTLPDDRGVLEWSETIAAVGVAASDAIFAIFAPGADADENTADMLDPSGQPVVVAGTDQITVSVAFREPTSGPIAILWKVF